MRTPQCVGEPGYFGTKTPKPHNEERLILEFHVQVLVLHDVGLSPSPNMVFLPVIVDVHPTDEGEHEGQGMLGDGPGGHATEGGGDDVSFPELLIDFWAETSCHTHAT